MPSMDTMNEDDLRMWPDKIVGKSFKYGDFTGWWYEDSRLEVHYKREFLVMEYYIDPKLANSQFLYVAGVDPDQCYDRSIDAEITESDD